MKRSSCIAVMFAVVACDSSLQPQPVVQLGRDEPPPAAACGLVPQCEGKCCPMAAECYPKGNPSAYSGAECLAMQDNTGQARRTYRQTLSVSTTPPGFSNTLVGDFLVLASGLKSAACGTPNAVSGFIQLIDFNHANGTSRTGFAKFAPELQVAAKEGLCFVEDVYDDADYGLAAFPTPANWPPGLPPPMPLPWNMKVVTSIRLAEDFDLSVKRTEILSRFAEGGRRVSA